MPRRRVGRLLALLGLAAMAWGLPSSAARAQNCATCNTATACPGGQCQMFHCPPWYHHCQERPPIICIKPGCPRPVCNPCGLPNFGYYQTCWTPWPLPPDWGHCPVTPPAAYVQLAGPLAFPGAPNTGPALRTNTAPGSIAAPPGSTGPSNPLPPLPSLDEREQFPTPRPMVPGPSKLAP
jgi:hypothetical protein